MFGTVGGQELLLILVIALIVFGPRKLPEIGKSLGRMMGEFRRASNDFKRTLEDEVDAEKLRSAPVQPVEAPRAEPSSAPSETVPAGAEPAAPVPAASAPEDK